MELTERFNVFPSSTGFRVLYMPMHKTLDKFYLWEFEEAGFQFIRTTLVSEGRPHLAEGYIKRLKEYKEEHGYG